MKFRRDIQGLRALAVVFVVLYHASPAWLPGGFLGVDIFFVISGFLISRIIIGDIEAGRFSYAHFYARRVRRLFPALFVMLACVSAIGLAILSPFSLQEFGKTLVATATFVSNVLFERLSGYFEDAAALKPLLHTWSLAVEEQFYLLFPVLLVATWRWARGRFFTVLTVCGIISLALYFWLRTFSPNGAFFLGPPRAFELIIGAIIALDRLPRLRHRMLREASAGAGMALMLVCGLSSDIAHSVMAPLLSCLGAAAILHAGLDDETNSTARLLGRPSANFAGAISYSLYLWHWPVLSLLKNYLLRDLTGLETAGAVAVSVLLAILSWRFIERPVLARPLSRKLVAQAMAASLTAIVLGAAFIFSNGFPQRFTPRVRHLFAYRNDTSPVRERCHDEPRRQISYAASCRFGMPGAGNAVAIWADSFGAELAPALGRQLPERTTLQLTSSGCPPALNYNPSGRPRCSARNREILTGLVHDSRVRVVVLAARYFGYENDDWPAFRSGFEQTVAALRAAGKRVILVYPVPEFFYSAPDAVGLLAARAIRPQAYHIDLKTFRHENAQAFAELDRISALYHLPRVFPDRIFCSEGICPAYDGHAILYFDNMHISMSGAKRLAAAVAQVL